MFAIHLGGNLYLDSDGSVVHTVTPATRVYPPPDGLHFDAEKVAETLKKFAELFPHSEEDKVAWAKFGVRADVIRSLWKFGKYASVVAGVATGIAIVGVVFEMLNILSGSDDLSPELKKELNVISNQLEGMEESDRIKNILQLHALIGAPVKLARDRILLQLAHEPSGEQKRQLYQELRSIVDQLAEPLARLDNEAWVVPYHSEKYNGSAFLSVYLHFVTKQGVVPAWEPRGATHFDYRLGVPMYIYASATLLGLLRVAIPWHRSGASHAETLRALADAIDNFVVRIQAESLTKTSYNAQSLFSARVAPPYPFPVPPDWFYKVGGDPIYPVGAFDLVRYSDAFLIQQYAQHHPFGSDRGKRACFNYAWAPPNPDNHLNVIAQDANVQADSDYHDLLVATGAFELLQTATRLREAATPPPHSETVRGKVFDSRTTVDDSATTARSPYFPFANPVQHPAKLRRYTARSRARILTQEPGYTPAFRYRVVVRTLASRVSSDGWGGRAYDGWAWNAWYEDSSAGPKIKRLRTALNKAVVLDQRALYEGISPAELVSRPPESASGRIRMRASTFDWYVPNVTADLPFVPTEKMHPVVDATLPPGKPPKGIKLQPSTHGLGAVSIHLASNFVQPGPMQTLGLNHSTLVGQVDEFWAADALEGPDASAMEHAERRHVREEEVELDWSLTWQDGQLVVRLAGRPDQRPFQVFVVVEENVYNGEPLPHEDAITPGANTSAFRAEIHTAFASEIVNQIVFVPQGFFIKEHWELEEAKKRWDRLMEKLRNATLESTRPQHVGVDDGLVRMIADTDKRLQRFPSTATLVDVYRERFEFVARESPYLAADVLTDTTRRVPEGWPKQIPLRRIEAAVHDVNQKELDEEREAEERGSKSGNTGYPAT